jgi:predicted adenylyl cyclase CyaB
MEAAQQPAVSIGPAMPRNIELKARLADLSAAGETARRLATEHLGVVHQTDTYFRCTSGRLKLRETQGSSAQLIWYARPDQDQPKASDYLLVAIPEPALLKQALISAHGVLVVVEKQREIFLHNNVRIHLDEVTGLGSFLEFEAVLSPEVDDQQGQEQVAQLKAEFSIADADLLRESYSDLLMDRESL